MHAPNRRAPKFSEDMRPRKFSPRLTPLVIAALLLSVIAPASQAQRRRARTRTHTRSTQRTRQAAPRPSPSQTEAAPQPARSVSQPATTVEARPRDAAVPSRATEAEEQRRSQESDRTLEELVAADTYGAYAELRRVGTLAQADALKTAIAGLKLLGDAEAKPVTDLAEFVSENSEPLAEARAVMLFLPARTRVPQGLLAIEFPTAREAAAFEPKYRQFADTQLKAYMAVQGPKASTERMTTPVRARGEKPETKPPAFDYSLRRVGRMLIASDKPVSLKRLRGEESAPTLADSARFQTARTRFASDSLFVYVDTGVTTQGLTRFSQNEEEQRGTPTVAPPVEMETEETVVAPAISSATATKEAQATPQPTTEEIPGPEEEKGEDGEEGNGPEVVRAEAEARKPPKEERAVDEMGLVMRGLWGGVPRMPGTFALGARLEGGTLALRLAVENSPDGKINVLPFLPNLVAGPPTTAEAAEVAPADAAVFFATSLDWEQVYTSTLGTASLDPLLTSYEAAEARGPHEGGAAEKPPTPEEMVAAVEKLFDFKFKEDLIPSLGNEVAVSMPFDVDDIGIGPSRRRSTKKEEKDAEPGIVFIVTLNDAEKVQKILPRVLVALGFVPFGSTAAQAEKREGFEIHSSGELSYAFINRFLVMGELKPVRHVVDSYAAHRTLASTDSYRDSTGWQAPQKLVQAFVSDALMRSVVEATKKRSGASTDPLVRTLLAQLEAPPEAASFETTNEGDAVIHELRVPVSMIQTYGLAMMVSVRDSPVQMGEMMAASTMYELHSAETTFKDEKKKGRYGTLEELIAEKVLEKDFAEHSDYRVELNASGEKFDATVTPKEYGKNGRCSFFVDETGTVRAADHKGRPATADDPPVD
jgi:hypothetical protein